MNYVEVAVARQRVGYRFYTYEYDSPLKRGDIILVPFNRKKAFAVVLSVVKKPDFATKAVSEKTLYALPESSIELLEWMTSFYPDDFGALAGLLLPSTFPKRIPKTTVKLTKGENKPLLTPTPEQNSSIHTITENNRVLLHGDTGTGKTQVFLHATKNTINSGKSVLIITPEIGLTPQLVTEITSHISAPILLTHSELTDAERRKVWLYALHQKTPSVYVGPRSALFLPFENLGLVVIDEAHDGAYKQGQSPRYQAGHIATKLAGLHSATLIQSTATPNISDYQQAIDRGYSLPRLTQLAAGLHRSQVELIDITNRKNFTKNQYLSDQLLVGLKDALNKNEQAIIFLNRRGSARLVQCSGCGWQALCPTCGIPLTYHHDVHTLRCHSCSHQATAPSSCPDCGSVDLQFKSIGTKTLVEQIQKLYPSKVVMRFDTDNTASEQLHKHVASIKAGDVDIVIGTQLISKGIDLPNLGFVGVVNADTGLNLPDFRSEELTFQQLHQVIGRVDRGHRVGSAIVQTRIPEHPVMQAVLNRSWDDFASYELHKRKAFSYPPYCYLAQFQITKNNAKLAEIAANKMIEKLQTTDLKIQVLGPSPSFFEQKGGGSTWQIIAKSMHRSDLVNAARLLPADWRADIDPLNLL